MIDFVTPSMKNPFQNCIYSQLGPMLLRNQASNIPNSLDTCVFVGRENFPSSRSFSSCLRERMRTSWLCVVLTVCALFTLCVRSQTCDANGPRTDCGYSGITQSECQAKGCCWSPLNPNPDNGERERKRER